MVAEGSQVPEPDAPRRSGYSFLGWYIAGTSTKYDFTTPVTSDMTLEARWSRNTTYYTVVFNDNKPQDANAEVENMPTTVSIASGGIIGDKASPTLDGYVFSGWYTDVTLQTAFDLTSNPVTSDLVLYAKWIISWDGTTEETDSIIQQVNDAENIIEIRTAAELAGLARIVNGDEVQGLPDGFDRTFTGKTIRIMNDIDLNGKLWTPIGKTGNLFQASTIEGNPAKGSRTAITGLMNNEADGRYHIGGLFGRMSSGNPVEIRNISISGEIAVTTSFGNNSTVTIGGLIAYMTVPSVTFDNCSFENGGISMDGPDLYTIGGLAGYILSTTGDVTFSRCEIGSLNISGDSKTKFIGGLAGSIQALSNNISISECTSNATMTTDNADASIGFLAGAGYPVANITIDNCNDVSGNGYKAIGNKN